MIGAGQAWPIASAWVGRSAAGLEKNSPRMHDMIGHRVRAFLQGLARGQTGVQVSKLDFRETRCDTGFKLVKVPVLQGIMNLLTSPNPSTDSGLHGLEEPR
jgi:hypothetical protein